MNEAIAPVQPQGAAKRSEPLLLPVVFAALAAIKIGFLIAFGPIVMPDTEGYTGFADAIVAGRLSGPGLTEGDFPVTLFRIAGYPLVIAAAKTIAGGNALWLVAIFQSAVSLVATGAVYRLARVFGLGTGLALAVAMAQATSLPLALDQVIITDSLHASMITLAICALAGAILHGHLGIVAAAGVGAAIATAFLLREAMMFLVAAFIPLAAAAAFSGCSVHAGVTMQRKRLWRGAIGLAFIILPLFTVQQAYKEWNRSRAGAAVVTTGAQTAILQTLVEVARDEPGIFSGDMLLDHVARATLRNYDFVEVRGISTRLADEHNRSAAQIAADAYAAYFRAWREHPAAMLRIPLPYLREWQARLTVRPLASVRELILWSSGDDFGFASWRGVREGRWWMAPPIALRFLSEAAAIVVFAGFLLLTPWRTARERPWPPPVVASMAIWMLYLGFFAIYAVVHIEPRYLAPIVPGSLVVGVVNLQWLLVRRRKLA